MAIQNSVNHSPIFIYRVEFCPLSQSEPVQYLVQCACPFAGLFLHIACWTQWAESRPNYLNCFHLIYKDYQHKTDINHSQRIASFGVAQTKVEIGGYLGNFRFCIWQVVL